jgi:hypothetical protein
MDLQSPKLHNTIDSGALEITGNGVVHKIRRHVTDPNRNFSVRKTSSVEMLCYLGRSLFNWKLSLKCL